MDADGACTTIPDPRLSLVTSALLCASYSPESRYTCLMTQLQSCHHVLAVDGHIATKSWSMMDEGSSEVTLEVERIVPQVSTV